MTMPNNNEFSQTTASATRRMFGMVAVVMSTAKPLDEMVSGTVFFTNSCG